MSMGQYDRSLSRLQYLLDALKIETNDCQIWPFGKLRAGYGVITYQGKLVKVHRLSLKLTNPDFDDSLCSLHDCPNGDNPSCFNPRHLWQGTKAENNADRSDKGRSAYGERNGFSKLTEDRVRKIRQRWAAGETQTFIAAETGIDQSHISDIVNKKAWKHIL